MNELPNPEHNQKSLEGVWGTPFFRKVPPGASMRSIEASWKTPLKKGISKPFPKLFDMSLLRNGLRCVAIFHADVIIANFGKL